MGRRTPALKNSHGARGTGSARTSGVTSTPANPVLGARARDVWNTRCSKARARAWRIRGSPRRRLPGHRFLRGHPSAAASGPATEHSRPDDPLLVPADPVIDLMDRRGSIAASRTNVYRIAFLGSGCPSRAVESFRQALRELSLRGRRNITVDGDTQATSTLGWLGLPPSSLVLSSSSSSGSGARCPGPPSGNRSHSRATSRIVTDRPLGGLA
jgi:hypothetical protein